MTQFETRPATDADATVLSAFLNECTLVHQGIARTSPDDAAARLHLGGADPHFDSFVVFDADRIVGLAHVWRDGEQDEIKFFARTHPGSRGRGVGSHLVRLCDGRADELLPGGRRSTTTWAADVDGPPLMRMHGFGDVRHYLNMRIDAAAISTEEPAWPEGVDAICLSEYPSLAGPLYDAWQVAFADEWGGYDETEEGFWHARREAKAGSAFAFDPTLWLLAREGDSVVGFCLCEIGTTEGTAVGRVSEIGVIPPRRGVGLGPPCSGADCMSFSSEAQNGSCSTSMQRT